MQRTPVRPVAPPQQPDTPRQALINRLMADSGGGGDPPPGMFTAIQAKDVRTACEILGQTPVAFAAEVLEGMRVENVTEAARSAYTAQAIEALIKRAQAAASTGGAAASGSSMVTRAADQDVDALKVQLKQAIDALEVAVNEGRNKGIKAALIAAEKAYQALVDVGKAKVRAGIWDEALRASALSDTFRYVDLVARAKGSR